jgi:hypothetical protein
MILRVAFLLISTILLGHAQSPNSLVGTSNGLSFWAIEHYKHILLANEVASDLRLSSQQKNVLRPILNSNMQSKEPSRLALLMRTHEARQPSGARSRACYALL